MLLSVLVFFFDITIPAIIPTIRQKTQPPPKIKVRRLYSVYSNNSGIAAYFSVLSSGGKLVAKIESTIKNRRTFWDI